MAMYFEVAERVRSVLTSAGLVFDSVNLSGELTMCGTTQKPHGTAGRYKVHADFPPCVWFVNYHEGGEAQTVKLYERGEVDAMTEAEREALRERIRQEKEENSKRIEEARRAAAEKANRLFQPLPRAGDDNAYLRRKGMTPRGDMRQADDGKLVLPVRNADGAIVSLQFVDGEGNKRFLKDGEKAGCYFPIPAKDGGQGGVLLIGEGAATMLSLCMATGYAGLVAFDCGNLEAVARMARAKYPKRSIVICADNDCETTRKDGTAWNPGVEAATKAAQAVGAKLAICPAINGRKSDFNDVHTATDDGLERVRVCVEKALANAKVMLPEGFIIRETGAKAGLYQIDEKANGETQEIWLGPPLTVHGYTRDTDGREWGLLLEWKDPDGKAHQWAMPLSLLSKDGSDWHAELVSGGWVGDPRHKRRLATFFTKVKPQAFVRCVPRVGWHDRVFVFPDETVGVSSCEKVVLQVENACLTYRRGGTLEGWQELAKLAVGNSRLSLTLCAAFAGPLLRLAGLESGGFNLVGGSSTGKSTAQKLAASVFDAPEYLRSWRTTDNGLEGVAALHNDALLLMDELGQAPAKVINEAAYMLGAGQGKIRAGRNGEARRQQTWRLVILSSGEVTLATKLGEDGRKPKAGQEVRLVDLDADAGHGLGIVENLHGFTSSGAFIRHIQEQSALHYGHAARAFLAYVATHYEEVAEEATQTLRKFVEGACPTDADGQVRRVAQRFGLCAYAGELAIRCHILPWEKGEAVRGVSACFKHWLAMRGSAGASEDAAILSAVRQFIERYGNSRFQDIDKPDAICVDRAGFRQTEDGKTEYVILSEVFSKVVEGHNKTRAAKVLRGAGWLRQTDDKLQAQRTLPGLGRSRCYAVVLPND